MHWQLPVGRPFEKHRRPCKDCKSCVREGPCADEAWTPHGLKMQMHDPSRSTAGPARESCARALMLMKLGPLMSPRSKHSYQKCILALFRFRFPSKCKFEIDWHIQMHCVFELQSIFVHRRPFRNRKSALFISKELCAKGGLQVGLQPQFYVK